MGRRGRSCRDGLLQAAAGRASSGAWHACAFAGGCSHQASLLQTTRSSLAGRACDYPPAHAMLCCPAGGCACLGTMCASYAATPGAGRWAAPAGGRCCCRPPATQPCLCAPSSALRRLLHHTPSQPSRHPLASQPLASQPLTSGQVHYVPPPPEPGSGQRAEPPVLLACEDGKPTFERLIGLLKGVQGSRSAKEGRVGDSLLGL